MNPNIPALAAAALIPLLLALVWYSPAVLGRVVTDSRLSATPRTPARAALRVVLLILLGAFLVVAMMPATIHQMHIYSILAGQPQAEIDAVMGDLMGKYGNVYRTFKHGAFHGTLTAIFLALPILGISAIAERKPIKVLLVHLGYWIITLALVGGVVCGYGF